MVDRFKFAPVSKQSEQFVGCHDGPALLSVFVLVEWCRLRLFVLTGSNRARRTGIRGEGVRIFRHLHLLLKISAFCCVLDCVVESITCALTFRWLRHQVVSKRIKAKVAEQIIPMTQNAPLKNTRSSHSLSTFSRDGSTTSLRHSFKVWTSLATTLRSFIIVPFSYRFTTPGGDCQAPEVVI